MVRTFKVAVVGTTQEVAASLASELGQQALTETTFEVDYEGWKVYVFVTSPEYQTALPKVLDAVLLALNGEEPTDEFKEYIKKFDGVIHKIAAITNETDVAFATSLSIRTSTERGVIAQFPTFLALDQELTELIQREFTTFDRDSSGFIDLQELKEISRQLGQDLNEEELQTALRELDTNQDGKISLEEFTAWWKSGRQGKNKIMRKLTQGVAKVKHLLDNAHAEIVRLTEVEEEAKYINVSANITKGDLTAPQLGLNLAAFNSDNECRTKANAQYPEEDKTYYIQIGLKTANPEAFAEQSKKIYKEAVKAASVLNPEAAMATAFIKLTTSFDEEWTYINISSDFAEMIVQEATKYRAFLCPTLPMHVKFDVVSGGDIGAGVNAIINSDLTVSFEAKIAQVLQQLWLEFAETISKVEYGVKSELPAIITLGLLQGVNFNLSTLSATDLPVISEVESVFEEYRAMIRSQISGLSEAIPGLASIVSQVKDNVDASEIRVVVAADILTLTSRIYAKNISKFLLG
jgi:Ca2+-binding EF-hand superfamily protein